MQNKGKNFLLRWAIGLQDTGKLSDFDSEKYQDLIWLARLSIASFQCHFPEADFLLLYNGPNFDDFLKLFHSSSIALKKNIQIINQKNPQEHREKFNNPYHFHPRGVWWKWVPFRFDITKHEICIDTDIICLKHPSTWYEWLDKKDPIIVTPERFKTVQVNTCGDFYRHPMLVGKRPFNCGVVGQKSGFDFSARFFEITKEVKLGSTHDSMFITEQGAINLWIRSLELEGYSHYCLDFIKNSWVRDFIYFARNGREIETIHAVAWHKGIVKHLAEIFERKVFDATYSQEEFVSDIIIKSSTLDAISQHVILRQLLQDSFKNDFLIQ